MRPSVIIRSAAAALLLCGAAVAAAGPVRLSFRAVTVTAGTTFDVPIYVDSTLTGAGVTAYEVDFSYSNTVVTYAGVSVAGTMTQAWGNPEVQVLPTGRIRVVGAGASALAGTGVLVTLQFSAPSRTSIAYASFSFQSALFNEGAPPIVTTNAQVTISPSPSITVYPNTAVVLRGEQSQFTASGGRSPYAWSTTAPGVATISGGGLLSALNAGFVSVVAIDADGVQDTSGGVEVRGMRLSLRDTSRYQGQFLDLPIYTTSLTGLGIISGQVALTFNTTVWLPVDVIRTGSLTAGTELMSFQAGVNSVSVSFSGTNPLSGAGVLFYLRLQASTAASGGVGFNFGSVLFNENMASIVQGATITATPLAAINVAPSSAITMMTGDSIRFTASGGIPPYGWTVSDLSKAAVASDGWFRAKRGGTITVQATDAVGGKGSSGTINIYDLRVSMPDTTYSGIGQVEYPIRITANDTGFTSFQFLLSYPTTNRMRLVGVNSAGTISNGWSVMTSPLPGTNGNVMVAGASSGAAIFAGGVLLNLVFDIPDTAIRPSGMTMAFSSPAFNEGFPRPLASNGTISLSGSVFAETPPAAPVDFVLGQNYPNPFNPSTTIGYQLSSEGMVRLSIFDLLGREVALLAEGVRGPGVYRENFDASGLPSGVYLYRLQVGAVGSGKRLFEEAKRLVLLR